MIPFSWYFGSWESIYFNVLYAGSKLQRFKIIIGPDLSDASLHFTNISEIILDDFVESLQAYKITGVHDGYRICEDALVYFWSSTLKTYTGLISTPAPFTNTVTRWNKCIDSLCPASGRFVYCSDEYDGNLVVVDLF